MASGRVYGPDRPYIDRTTPEPHPFIRLAKRRRMQGVGAAGFKSCDCWSEMEAKEDTLRIRVVQGTGWKGKCALPLQPYLHKDPSWPFNSN
ncbi:hypothetical protein F2Q69_00011837 [Brassica cretica]|uniref:Uncharacterized protein n=1 Tax=Brassica cretica TaxID=69181 RepID=A0A8S9QXM2_BRACR|nr:hypothetical protein F2Q69_00011837 [Brassica cretica]